MKICEYCKVQYAEKRNFQRFCSPNCQNKNWFEEHPGKRAEYDRAKYKKNKESIIIRVSAWRKKNLDKTRKYFVDWVLRNPEKAKISGIARTKKWHDKHPLKVRAIKLERRCRLSGNGGNYTPEEWQGLLDKSNGSCLMCRQPVGIKKLTVDHILPVSLGGTNFVNNLQPLCHSCNAKKHTKVLRFDYNINQMEDEVLMRNESLATG